MAPHSIHCIMAWLVVETPRGEQRCALGPTNMLGRHPDSAIQILDPRASKRHCLIYQRGYELWLRDFDSANGTTVNQIPVRAEVLLKHEDRIQIGSTILRLLERLPENTAPLPPAPAAPVAPPMIVPPMVPPPPDAVARHPPRGPQAENGLLIVDRSGDVRVRLWNVRVSRGGFFLRIPLVDDRPLSSRLHHYVGKGSHEELLLEKGDLPFEELLARATAGGRALPEYERVHYLNKLVYRALGGYLTPELFAICDAQCKAYAGRPIPIGELIRIGVGFCRHRAFLFFHLARRLGLRVELYRGAVSGGRHAWNEVRVGADRVFVDTTLGVVLDDALEAEQAYGYLASRHDVPQRRDEPHHPSDILVVGEGDAERIELPSFRHELRKVPGDEEAVLLLYPESDLPEVRYLHVHFHLGGVAVAMFAMNALTSARVFSIVGDEAHHLMDALDRDALARALQGAPR